MNWVRLAIHRHVLTWMLNGLIVLAGWVAFERIGVDRYPRIDFPMISVTTVLAGANPDIIDASITNVVESAVNSVPGIEHVQSDSFPGASVVRITFELEKDIDVAFNEVQAKVNQVLSELPDDAETPVVAKVEFGAVPILWLTLSGDRTLQQLNQYARLHIKKRLENVAGVGEVRFGGRRERTIRVQLDPARLSAYGLTVGDVVAAFSREHFQLPGGFLVGRERELLIKLDLEFHKPAEIGELIVAARGGATVRLRDIATVEDGTEDARRLARFGKCPSSPSPGGGGGEVYAEGTPRRSPQGGVHGVLPDASSRTSSCHSVPAVGLGIVKVTGANAVTVIQRVKQRLDEEILPQLPPGLRIDIAIDDLALILALVGALEEHLVLGTLLTALVVWLFLKNLRATLIIALAIPVSLLGAVAVMYFAGFTFNTMTLLGLLLLIGIVVDDAIVVLENIYRHREEDPGTDPFEAAEAGTRQVVFAVVAASLTLVSIFASVLFMGGVIGSFFRSFSVVVSLGVLVSLFVSISLTPMLCARYLEVVRRHGPLYLWLERGFRALESGYRRLLEWTLRHRVWVVVLAVMAVLPSGFFLGQLGKGFLPEEDEGRFLISFKAPLGSSLRYTEGRLREMEKVLASHREIASWFAVIGGGASGQASRGDVFVRLVPRGQRDTYMYRLIDRLRGELAKIPGLQAFPAPIPPLGGQRGEPLQFVLQGPDVAGVAEQSRRLLQALRRHPELGTIDLDLQLELPQLRLRVDRTRARQLGLPAREVALAVNVLAGGLNVAKFNDEPGDGERYDVRLKAAEGTFRAPADLRRIFLRSSGGRLVRLDTVARWEERVGPAVVTRFDLRYSGNFFATPKVSEGEAAALVKQIAASLLPRGYRVKMIGRAEEFEKTAGYMLFALVAAVVLVYMVLASQFNAFLQPLVIMAAQPLAVVGGLAGLWLTGRSLNMFSMMGLVLLMGLVAKNSILLVDLTNQLRAQGRGIDEALREACPVRLRPVLMTSLTVIVTMLPAVLGLGAASDTAAPLAAAVVGGMVSSTLLTMVVVPALYSLLEHGLRRWRKADTVTGDRG
ncbi:hydrophobic/amphiphilic exporter-1, HAE1 family [Methylomarinovum caldicuralii]|uniref:Hydrophobic/amphiphilic exporter-1, HAE1 family n=1 Tax=Methylomarinovum caldicuralii TaxID=438856 RepID=A0AAU9CA80_9GAMM|nr:efflux RND transporter permease subunit [Methylomarinovum caldicuralii]BCX82506.1 hydrophobic/amphiphilic exporter-1, HAE1 family [Methylomarinovum caldicuralii]